MTIKIIKILFFTFTTIIFGQTSLIDNLSFNYRNGDVLTYQLEEQDSIQTTSNNSQILDEKNLLLRKTLSITGTPPKAPYTVNIQTDTMDIIHPAKFQPNLIEKEINQILYKAQEGEFKFKANGIFIKGRALLTPLIFTLSEAPVQMNSIWKYDQQNKYNDNGKFRAKQQAECLVYDIQPQVSKTIVILIINTRTEIKGDFKKQDIHIRLTGDYIITDKATHIVYFNTTLGCTERIISENHIQWEVTSNAATISKSIKRKSRLKLVEPQ